MMHGREKSDLVIVAMKPANKANETHCGGICGANAAEPVERRAGAKGSTHQQSTYWTLSQARASNALERIRQDAPSHTRGRSRMRESRTYGSGRGACDETHVPTATTPRVHHASRRCGGSWPPTARRAAAGEACGASACSYRRPRTTGNAFAPHRLLHNSNRWDGQTGCNIHIDIRSSASDAERIQNHTAELVTFRPDVILALVAQPRGRCCRRTTPFRTSSCKSWIQSVRFLSKLGPSRR